MSKKCTDMSSPPNHHHHHHHDGAIHHHHRNKPGVLHAHAPQRYKIAGGGSFDVGTLGTVRGLEFKMKTVTKSGFVT